MRRLPRLSGQHIALVLSSLLVALVALWLRVADLGQFLTHDEAEFWFSRSESLLRALASGNWEEMAVSTHPGVTTMWLGAAGITLRRVLFESGLLQHETFPIVLALHRLPVVLTHVAGILAGYALLRRLCTPSVALLAALLWATDPFTTGYSRLLHVDALAGTFATLCLLAACVAWEPVLSSGLSHPSRRWLVVSGICAGLALLSKSPALAVAPVVGVLALLALLVSRPAPHEQQAGPDGVWLRRVLVPLLVWGLACAATIALLWPAVWAAPAHVLHALRVGVTVEGAQPHMTGNFFLGQRTPVPDMRFYPVALVMRATPWLLVGLLLLPFARFRHFRHRATNDNDDSASAHVRQPAHTLIPVLVGFLLLFLIGLSIFPKKFNRYLVPVFPAANILAAYGLLWAQAWVVSRLPMHRARGARGVFVALVCGVALVNAVWYHPYAIVYYNQMTGGPQAGARTFAVGWGEGLEQAADWLNQQPDIADVLTISHMITSISPYLTDGARATFPKAGELKAGAGYVLVFVSQVQGGPPPPPFDQFHGRRVPLHTVTLHGVDYVWVYRAPPAVEHTRPATFGERIHLYGVTQKDAARRGQPVRFNLVWETTAQPPTDYWLFAHLVGSDGQRYTQVDLPYPTSTWVPGFFQTTEVPIDLPADMPPGEYRLKIGLYDPANGDRLVVTVPAAVEGEGTGAGAGSLLLPRFVVPE